jgi:hypothetical protein
VPLEVTGAAYYNGVVVASAAQPVASIAGASSKSGNFTAYGGTSRMVVLSLLLEKAGHEAVAAWTSLALDLHDYQYHGPDPDMALSKFRNREEAAEYTRRLAAEVARRVEALRGRVKWTNELEKALGEVRGALAR